MNTIGIRNHRNMFLGLTTLTCVTYVHTYPVALTLPPTPNDDE